MNNWDQKKYSYCIGIDSGKDTGIAVWDRGNKKFDYLATRMIHQAMEKISEYIAAGHEVKVFVEDARLRKKYGTRADFNHQGVGSIKRDAKMWEDWLKDKNIPYEMKHPGKGITKLSKELFARLTKYTGLTSQHARDAGMIVYGM